MASATTTKATDAKDGAARLGRVRAVKAFVKEHCVERDEAIDLMFVATCAGLDPLYLGPPGVAKTWQIELLCDHGFADDVALFTHLLAKDQSADEVLGPRSLGALNEDRIARMIEGFLPTAHYGYLDEVFKASPPMLNPLLDLIANRVLKMGGQTVDCKQLVAVFMSSNELPDREDLEAFRDRIAMTYVVEPVKTPEGRRRVSDIQIDFQANGIDASKLAEQLTLNDLAAIRTEVAMVSVGDAIRDMMIDAQQKWAEAGHPPSQRRVGQMWRAIKANAWLNGRSDASSDDLLVCQHMAFNSLDDRKTAREVVLQFASAFTRKAERLRQAFQPMLQQMEDLRVKLDAAGDDESAKQEIYTSGMKFLGDLRRLGKEAKSQIKDGEKQGQDVTPAQELLAEIEKANEWASGALIGEL